MKWDTREENLILEVIENHRKLLQGRESKLCPFCAKYRAKSLDDYCTLCPNKRISDLLGLDETYADKYDKDLVACDLNLFYLEKNAIEFNWCLGKVKEGLLSEVIVKRRIQLWQDALEITETEFVKKYKKGEK